ncbi:Uncharacterised protein [Enterobacter cloacae]|nr:Uncharacterised protein [Enterobacter cloacae]
MTGQQAQIGLPIGGEDCQNMFLNAVAFYLADQCFCTLPEIGPANFTDRFAFPNGLMRHHAKARLLLG